MLVSYILHLNLSLFGTVPIRDRHQVVLYHGPRPQARVERERTSATRQQMLGEAEAQAESMVEVGAMYCLFDIYRTLCLGIGKLE